MARGAAATKRINPNVAGLIEEHENGGGVMTLAEVNALAAATDGQPEDADLEDEALSRVIADLRADAEHGDASVKVFRIIEGTRKLPFCFECEPSAFTLSLVAQKYGGGDYLIRIYWTDPETGRYGVKRAVRQTIAPPLDGVVPGTKPDANATTLSATDAKIDRLADVIAAMATRNPADAMKESFALMGMMRDAMGINSAPQHTAVAADPVAALKQMLEVQGMLKDIARDNVPDGKSDTQVMLETVRELAPVMTQALSQSRAEATSLPNHTAPEKMQMDSLTIQLGMLAAAAKMQKGTALYVDMILDSMDNDAEEDALLALLESPDWFEQLSRKNVLCSPYRAWFEKVRGELMAEFTVEDTVDTSDQLLTTVLQPVKQMSNATPLPPKSDA